MKTMRVFTMTVVAVYGAGLATATSSCMLGPMPGGVTVETRRTARE